MDDCPCGSNFSYSDCCAPLVNGTGRADTAEDLMRSRYSAYVKKRYDYLVKTSSGGSKTLEDYQQSCEQTVWQGLEINGVDKGQFDDAEGQVAFTATFTQDGKKQYLREHSHFIKKSGQWFYDEATSHPVHTQTPQKTSSKPFKREGSKVGRNDPCPCGSSKKYKKCCGK
ncbi:MAG: hypothetical protein G3M78_14240 [Candidatus Nitrohelix vancouverensis]|uniref:YchJ-like middle NTF2-like domain-containing protein n=1 Tax=Candidatus Nitrohelix vancouverensis TaxID=2705534 RepID=A0A7T0C4Q8_9BACT|nr:MAG: hypothetical protein G3M78_14240 [Candidatus Nitrohelix vancouverensis]